MTLSNIPSTDLHLLATQIADGDVTSREVTVAHLDRIAALDPRFHAFASITADLALAEADRADAARAAGQCLGPLHGVPLAVKDAIDDTLAPARFGNPVLHRKHRGAPSTVMTRLRAAGAVCLGKLILTEGVWVQHHPETPDPVNPHGAAFWTGNSSSGSGVALASGMVPGTVGSDTGGSIRLPSGCCGVTGMKPTWGRISVAGVHALAPSFDTIGPMARTARDVALLMDVLAGPDPADPTCLAQPAAPCQVTGPADLRGLRFGFPTAEVAAADPAVQGAMQDAAQTFLTLGAEVMPMALPDPQDVITAWSALISAEAARVHRDSFGANPGLYGQALSDLIIRGQGQGGAALVDAMAVRRLHRGQMAQIFASLDAVLLPALPVGGPGNAFMASFEDDKASTQLIGRYTVPFNMCGFPTLTLPCGRSADDIPIGMQICGAPLSEASLCRIGAAFQDATDWHGTALI